jgi:hypothetical protein
MESCEIDEDLLFPLKHRQVAIRYNDLAADVDEGIADLILACWRADIWTWSSCQNVNGFIWIGLPDAFIAERFLTAAVGDRSADIESVYQRLGLRFDDEVDDLPEDFDFAAWEDRCWRVRASADDWNSEPDSQPEVAIGINVDFPVADYDTVLSNVRRAAVLRSNFET